MREAAVQAVTAASERWAKWRKTAAGELSLGCTGDVAMKSGTVWKNGVPRTVGFD